MKTSRTITATYCYMLQTDGKTTHYAIVRGPVRLYDRPTPNGRWSADTNRATQLAVVTRTAPYITQDSYAAMTDPYAHALAPNLHRLHP